MNNNIKDNILPRITWLFTDIYEKYDDFKDDILLNCGIENTTENINLISHIWKVLYREYCESNVMYDTIKLFKMDFYNLFEDNFEKIKKEISLVNKINKMKEDEINLINESISNNANNPNYEINEEDILKPIKYISNQVYSNLKGNKFVKYIQAIENIPPLRNQAIIDTFRKLFYNIYTGERYFYGK